MSFFYRRKRKPPSSTLFIPLLKLFQTTVPRKIRESENPEIASLPIDTGSPFLLSGPKSQYGLGISLHFIIIPDGQHINADLVWHYARREMRNALLASGISEVEADMYALRLIDPILLPPEITVEYPEGKRYVMEDLQRAVTYQLLQGKQYTGTLESIKEIYSGLAIIFSNLAAGRPPKSADAQEHLIDASFENIEVVIKQEEIEKRTILDISGKLREMAEFFEMFSQQKYLKRTTPQDPKVVHQLFSKKTN
ncbi:MAG: hypothetical protein ACFE9D_11870 [Promethearchaeota archaeon]